jgi:hypothetical protein
MVEYCTCPDCPLYTVRFGRPSRVADYTYQSGDERYTPEQMGHVVADRTEIIGNGGP